MVEYSATRPEPSLSLPIRLEQKRKRTQASVAAIAVGLTMLAGAGYNATVNGSELIAIYMSVLGIALLGVGIAQHQKAKRVG